jgi:hypothetical protein
MAQIPGSSWTSDVPHSSAGCHCGAIELEISAPIVVAVNCHCGMCRSMNGSAFSTYAPLESAAVRVASGQELLVEYQVTPGARKHWCRVCGSPLFNTNAKYPGLTMVYFGALRDHTAVAPRANIHCSSKVPWVDSLAQLNSYDESRTAAHAGR